MTHVNILLILWPISCRSELHLKVNCRINFHFSAAIHLYMIRPLAKKSIIPNFLGFNLIKLNLGSCMYEKNVNKGHIMDRKDYPLLKENDMPFGIGKKSIRYTCHFAALLTCCGNEIHI